MPNLIQDQSVTKGWLPQGIPAKLGVFELQDLLGKGGMGMVFSAINPLMKRHVAIKVMNRQLTGHPDLVKRFLREIEILGQVPEHRNIVHATYAAQEGDIFYVVMEYVDGTNLNEFVNRRGPLSPADACDAIHQAALGLDVIHQAGLVHRDIKPSNLMITPDGVVKILDLGLARFCAEQLDEALTPVLGLLGTYDYQAPEQAHDAHNVAITADIYSLGCTFFKLLTGKAPYSHVHTINKTQAHATTPFPELPANVPAAMGEVLLRMVAKNPSDRWQTPLALAQALSVLTEASQLRALVANLPVSKPPQAMIATPVQTPLETNERSRSLLSFTWLAQHTPRWLKIAGGLGLSMLLLLGLYVTVWGRSPLWTQHLKNLQVPVVVATLDQLPNLDNAKEVRWYSLLNGEAKPIVWHDPSGDAHFKPDPDNTKLFVSNSHASMVGVGRTTLETFTLQVLINQPKWQGQTGIFWGYRTLTDNEKERPEDEAVFQMILIQDYTKRDLSNKDRFWALVRGVGTVCRDKNGKDIDISTCYFSQSKMPGLKDEQALELSFDKNKLKHVRFNGVECLELTAPDLRGRTKDMSCQGALGTYNYGSTTIFRDFRFKAFRPANY